MLETDLHELVWLVLVFGGKRFQWSGCQVLNQDAEVGTSILSSISHALHFLVLENLAVSFLEQFFLIFSANKLGVLTFSWANSCGRGSSFLERRFAVLVRVEHLLLS